MQEAEKELQDVMVLLRQSLDNSSAAKQKRSVPITEVLTPPLTAEPDMLWLKETHSF